MRNKKGNLPIVVLVFLVLTLLIASIFTGYLMQKNAFSNYDFERVQIANSNKLLFEQNLYVVLKDAFVKTFYEFSLAKEYDYVKGRKNTGEFSELHEMLEENFEVRFRQNFLEILNSLNTSEKKLEQQYLSLGRGFFDLDYSNEKLKLNFSYFSMNEQGTIPQESFFSGLWLIGRFFEKDSVRQEVISLTYVTPIEIFVDFEMVSLESFDEIYSAKENCKPFLDNQEKKNCFEKVLPNFLVEIEDVSDYVDNFEKEFPFETVPNPAQEFKLIRLKTKEYFVFAEDFEQINVTFVSR